jgi:DNA-binding MarR family transcriptional regulator
MLTTPRSVELANELRPVLLQVNRQLRKELAPLGITAVQAALLHAIRTTPGIGIRELAEREGMSKPAMTTAVDRLESMGLVRRTRSSRDARRVELELTDKGQRISRSARSRRTAWLAARLQRLDPQEREALGDAVAPLRRLLEGAE